MKIGDLSRLLEVIDVVKKDENGENQTTPEFKELCEEMLDLTQGPSTLYHVVPEQAVVAIARIVPLDGAQMMRIKKIVENSLHVTTGTMLKGHVFRINEPSAAKVEMLKALTHKLLEDIKADGDESREEVDEDNILEEFSEEESELDDKPLTKKEVIH
jgi:hypothetical protein